MVSQKPHGTIEYTVSIGMGVFHLCCFEGGVVWVKKEPVHKVKAPSETCLQFVPISVGIASDTIVWGELG